MTRSIASRWADLTEPATPNSCLRSPKGINAYRARLAGMATEGRHDVPTVSSQMGCVFHGCLQRRYSTSHHLLPAFPEGDKRLIGHGWPEWRPKGGMTCLPCLRSRRMDELCRSSTGYHYQQRIAPTTNHKTLNSYRVLIHSIRHQDRVVASRQPCPIKHSTPSG